MGRRVGEMTSGEAAGCNKRSRIRNFLICYLSCFGSTDVKPQQKKNRSSKVYISPRSSSSVHSGTASPASYTSMSEEERDESLKAAILYCKANSTCSVQRCQNPLC